MNTPVITTTDEQTDMPDTDSATYSEKLFIPGVVFTLLILLILGFTVFKIMDPETLPIRSVSIAGNFSHLSSAGLQERVGNIMRGGFFSVDVETMQEALFQEPWIQAVSVKRVWPDRIIVIIAEQVAVARWGGDGLLNSDAEIFYPDISTFPQDLPVVTGPENTNQLVLDSFMRIKEVLPEGLSLQQLFLSERRSWELQLNAGPLVRLGKSGIVSSLQRLLQHLHAEGISNMDQIQYIDMRYTNGFALMKKTEVKNNIEVVRENYGEKI